MQYWDSITKEDLEFSVGTKQGNWEVMDPLMAGAEDDYEAKRASIYGLPGARNSTYDNSSLDYNPRPASSHHYLGNNSNPRLSGHGYAQLTGARESYGDVRKSAQRLGSAHGQKGYSDFDYPPYEDRHSAVRDRSKGRPHARATSNEVVYDRY